MRVGHLIADQVELAHGHDDEEVGEDAPVDVVVINVKLGDLAAADHLGELLATVVIDLVVL